MNPCRAAERSPGRCGDREATSPVDGPVDIPAPVLAEVVFHAQDSLQAPILQRRDDVDHNVIELGLVPGRCQPVDEEQVPVRRAEWFPLSVEAAIGVLADFGNAFDAMAQSRRGKCMES